MGLSTDELSGMRAAINQLLPDACYVLTATNVSDGAGGVTVSWGTTGTTTCRLDVVSGMEQLTGGAIQPYTKYMVSLPYDTTLTQSNRIKVGTNTYSVKSINLGQSWSAVARVEVEKI